MKKENQRKKRGEMSGSAKGVATTGQRAILRSLVERELGNWVNWGGVDLVRLANKLDFLSGRK